MKPRKHAESLAQGSRSRYFMIISPSPRFQKQIFHDISSVSLTIKTHTHTHTQKHIKIVKMPMKWFVGRRKTANGCFVRSVLLFMIHSRGFQKSIPCGNRGFLLMVIMTLCSGAAAGSRVQHLQLLWQYCISRGPNQHVKAVQVQETWQTMQTMLQCYKIYYKI